MVTCDTGTPDDVSFTTMTEFNVILDKFVQSKVSRKIPALYNLCHFLTQVRREVELLLSTALSSPILVLSMWL